MRAITTISVLVSSCGGVSAFALMDAIKMPGSTSVSNVKSKNEMFEYIKFDKAPKFDVLSKTKEYVATQKVGQMSEDWYASDYILRGPVIGPINRADLTRDQTGLDLVNGFPDIEIDTFGYTIDPENPYRCYYMQRWRGTHTVDMDIYGTLYPATNNEMETPVSTFSVVWNPAGKIVYEQVGAVVDRLEGNTQGKAAVFGMLHTAGLKLSAAPGDAVFALIQRFGHLVKGQGRSWSKEEDIPSWWTSSSRGADGTEQN